MDPLAVHLAMTEAVEHMRAGNGPTVVEADTYRFFHQNGGFAGSAFGYRTKEEEQQWRARDPLTHTAEQLIRLGILSEDETQQAVSAGQGRDGRDRFGPAGAGSRTGSPGSGGSGPPNGPTPPGSTSACAATSPSSTTPR